MAMLRKYLGIESKLGGQSLQKMTIQSITINEDIDDDYFAYPKATKGGG